jgi:hypothetical protein
MSSFVIISRIFNWLLSLIGLLGIIGLVPLIAIGIVFLVKSSNETDTAKKSSYGKKGIVFVLLPFIMTIGSLILLVILKAF